MIWFIATRESISARNPSGSRRFSSRRFCFHFRLTIVTRLPHGEKTSITGTITSGMNTKKMSQIASRRAKRMMIMAKSSKAASDGTHPFPHPEFPDPVVVPSLSSSSLNGNLNSGISAEPVDERSLGRRRSIRTISSQGIRRLPRTSIPRSESTLTQCVSTRIR